MGSMERCRRCAVGFPVMSGGVRNIPHVRITQSVIWKGRKTEREKKVLSDTELAISVRDVQNSLVFNDIDGRSIIREIIERNRRQLRRPTIRKRNLKIKPRNIKAY